LEGGCCLDQWFDALFAEFVQRCQCPDWFNNSAAYVIWRDAKHAVAPGRIVRVAPLGSPSYLHAAIVLQQYLISMRSEAWSVPSLDLTAYRNAHADSDALYKFIMRNAGGVAFEAIQHMTQTSPADWTTPLTLATTRAGDEEHHARVTSIINHLKTLGPGLVSQFACDDSPAGFVKSTTQVSFGRTDADIIDVSAGPKEKRQYHSMVLLGYRVDSATGRVFFLLQNCWKNRIFVEMSSQYLASSGAKFTFCKKKLKGIPACFSSLRLRSHYAEAEAGYESYDGQ
jgi:hypothetical protein